MWDILAPLYILYTMYNSIANRRSTHAAATAIASSGDGGGDVVAHSV